MFNNNTCHKRCFKLNINDKYSFTGPQWMDCKSRMLKGPLAVANRWLHQAPPATREARVKRSFHYTNTAIKGRNWHTLCVQNPLNRIPLGRLIQTGVSACFKRTHPATSKEPSHPSSACFALRLYEVLMVSTRPPLSATLTLARGDYCPSKLFTTGRMLRWQGCRLSLWVPAPPRTWNHQNGYKQPTIGTFWDHLLLTFFCWFHFRKCGHLV